MIRDFRRDPALAVGYLKAAIEDNDDPRVLLVALRRLAQARGMAKVAKAAGVERESLYRALSVRGNPRVSTLVAVTKAIGQASVLRLHRASTSNHCIDRLLDMGNP